jgi:hypothetical protein
MFHPEGHPLERGWVGRIDGDRVVHLAAQTLQSFFTGGGSAREHAEYPLAQVCLLPPVLHPPAVRIFDGQEAFSFTNPAAVVGPGATIVHPSLSCNNKLQGRREPHRRADLPRDDVLQGELGVVARVAAVIGAGEAIAGFTALVEWRAPERPAPKDRDFALGLGPVVVTANVAPRTFGCSVRIDGIEAMAGALEGFDWDAARAFAADGTRLVAGDLLAGPGLDLLRVPPGSRIEVEVDAIGVLEQRTAG